MLFRGGLQFARISTAAWAERPTRSTRRRPRAQAALKACCLTCMRLYAIVIEDLHVGISNAQVEKREARAPKSRRPYRVVDSDVHALSSDGFNSIYPFMPIAWRERFT